MPALGLARKGGDGTAKGVSEQQNKGNSPQPAGQLGGFRDTAGSRLQAPAIAPRSLLAPSSLRVCIRKQSATKWRGTGHADGPFLQSKEPDFFFLSLLLTLRVLNLGRVVSGRSREQSRTPTARGQQLALLDLGEILRAAPQRQTCCHPLLPKRKVPGCGSTQEECHRRIPDVQHITQPLLGWGRSPHPPSQLQPLGHLPSLLPGKQSPASSHLLALASWSQAPKRPAQYFSSPGTRCRSCRSRPPTRL